MMNTGNVFWVVLVARLAAPEFTSNGALDLAVWPTQRPTRPKAVPGLLSPPHKAGGRVNSGQLF